MTKPLTVSNRLYKVVQVTHPDGQYFYGLTTDIQVYKNNLIRDYSAYKKSNGRPNNHASFNALSYYGAYTNVSPKEYDYKVLFYSKDKDLANHFKKCIITFARMDNDDKCMNIKVGKVD